MNRLLSATALALILAACSQAPEKVPDGAETPAAPVSSATGGGGAQVTERDAQRVAERFSHGRGRSPHP